MQGGEGGCELIFRQNLLSNYSVHKKLMKLTGSTEESYVSDPFSVQKKYERMKSCDIWNYENWIHYISITLLEICSITLLLNKYKYIWIWEYITCAFKLLILFIMDSMFLQHPNSMKKQKTNINEVM